LKGAFSGSVVGGGISDSESRSFWVSLGVVFLRPHKHKRAAMKAQRTTTTPTTTPAIAPAGRLEEPLDEEGEEDSAKVCVAIGPVAVPVGDTAVEKDEPDVLESSVEVAVGSIFRNVICLRVDTSSIENRSITKSRRGNIERLALTNNIPNISIRLCCCGGRIRKPSLLVSPHESHKGEDRYIINSERHFPVIGLV
jgi:hypothetical protein